MGVYMPRESLKRSLELFCVDRNQTRREFKKSLVRLISGCRCSSDVKFSLIRVSVTIDVLRKVHVVHHLRPGANNIFQRTKLFSLS